MLGNCRPHNVCRGFLCKEICPNAWNWISILIPCIYPSWSLTSLCFFALQQLFGLLHLKSIYNDVAHTLVYNFRLGNSSSACKCVSLALESCLCQVDRDNGSEFTCECVIQDGEHVKISTKAASITVLVFT